MLTPGVVSSDTHTHTLDGPRWWLQIIWINEVNAAGFKLVFLLVSFPPPVVRLHLLFFSTPGVLQSFTQSFFCFSEASLCSSQLWGN